MKTTGQHIANMLRTRRGSHCLFRSFGLNTTDSVGLLRKSMVSEEIARWYPSVKSIQVTRVGGQIEKGETIYNVTVLEDSHG